MAATENQRVEHHSFRFALVPGFNKAFFLSLVRAVEWLEGHPGHPCPANVGSGFLQTHPSAPRRCENNTSVYK